MCPSAGRDVVATAAAVRDGRSSARLEVERALDRVAALDGRLRAFSRVLADDARRCADDLDARRAGALRL